jgi:hypothetical protein
LQSKWKPYEAESDLSDAAPRFFRGSSLARRCDFSLAPRAQETEINNARIVEMTKMGLGDDIIIAKIKTSHTKFSLADNDLVELKKAGVSGKVVAAMMEAWLSSRCRSNAIPTGRSSIVSGSSAETSPLTTLLTSPWWKLWMHPFSLATARWPRPRPIAPSRS